MVAAEMRGGLCGLGALVERRTGKAGGEHRQFARRTADHRRGDCRSIEPARQERTDRDIGEQMLVDCIEQLRAGLFDPLLLGQ